MQCQCFDLLAGQRPAALPAWQMQALEHGDEVNKRLEPRHHIHSLANELYRLASGVERPNHQPVWLRPAPSCPHACCRPQVRIPVDCSDCASCCWAATPLRPPPAPVPLRRRPTSPTRRSSNAPLCRRARAAGSPWLSPGPLGCSKQQHCCQQRRHGGGGQAGTPCRAVLVARGPSALAALPTAAAVPGIHQRPRSLGSGQRPCALRAAAAWRGGWLLLAGEQPQVGKEGALAGWCWVERPW